MDCPDCKEPMEDDGFTLSCEKCYEWYDKCVICGKLMKAGEFESDICGHASCVEKKAERMFR